ncbi:MAG: hypothetical protein HN714_06405 [Formosa sp.]|nr:hypothetical protein [Formosa sp.]
MNDNKLIKNSLFLMLVISINCVVNAQQKSSSVFEIKAVSVNKESEKNLSTNFEEYSLFTMDTESLNRHAQANLNKELLLDLELPGIEKMNIVL